MKLVDPRENSILPSRNPCSYQSFKDNDKLNFLVIVKTAIPNQDRRTIIREFAPLNFKPLFVVGRNSSEQIPEAIIEEEQVFGDLLIGNFIDSFRNLTIKVLLGFNFAAEFCNQENSDINFILQIDDDQFINYDAVEELALKRYSSESSGMFLSCFRYSNTINRNPFSKRFVSRHEVSSDSFPNYCPGCFSMTDVRSLQNIMATLTKPEAKYPFWQDDVWLTGMLRSLSDVKIHRIDEKFRNVHNYVLEEWTDSNQNPKNSYLPYVLSEIIASPNIWTWLAGTSDQLKANGLKLCRDTYEKVNLVRESCGRSCLIPEDLE